tara:strand:- start:411 stop:611 length:201 start_codon:yes stop_codon:yes gene_type:complete
VKKQPKNWLIYSGLAFQIGTVMYLMIQLGQWITRKFEITSNAPVLITCLFGMVVVLLLIDKQSKNL